MKALGAGGLADEHGGDDRAAADLGTQRWVLGGGELVQFGH